MSTLLNRFARYNRRGQCRLPGAQEIGAGSFPEGQSSRQNSLVKPFGKLVGKFPTFPVRRPYVGVVLGCIMLTFLPVMRLLSQSTPLQPVADTYVAAGRPTQSQPADLRVFWVGYNQVDSYGKERALLQFDLSNLPANSTITSARLSLYLARAIPATDAPQAIQVSRLTGSWSETITWQQHEQLTRLSEGAATTTVGAQAGWVYWDLRDLVQRWLADPARGQTISLLLTGDESGAQHERAFWSKDCKPAECDTQPGKRPQLVIEWQAPTPTPTATATATPLPLPTATPTPIPSPTAMPTPGIQWVRLSNEPQTAIADGDAITYTISYQNGPYPLSDLQIVNRLPMQLTWLPDSLRTSSAALVTMQQTSAGTEVQWRFPLPIEPYQRGELVYRLRRGAVTPSSSGLTIHKQGPTQATVNDLIRYDLAVTNRTTTTLSNLLITDTIPLHAHYIAGGTRSGDLVYWHVAALAPGATMTNTFVVTATRTITNSDYGVRAGGGLAAKGATAVVTVIRRPDEAPLAETLVHTGGTMSWRYQGQAGQMPINPVYNPSYPLFLPLAHQPR